MDNSGMRMGIEIETLLLDRAVVNITALRQEIERDPTSEHFLKNAIHRLGLTIVALQVFRDTLNAEISRAANDKGGTEDVLPN